MKYIVIELDGQETIHQFPQCQNMTHAEYYRAIRSIAVNSVPGNFKRIYRQSTVVSAGFVTADGKCYGRSDSLDLNSREEEDTELLAKCYRGFLI